jgi:hypothetical protein
MKCSVSDLWSPQLQHSLIGIRIEKLRQPRFILVENRVPLRQSQPVWFRPRMHSTGQATWLPPSFPRSRVCVAPEAAQIVNDLMETSVQASSGWMVRRRVLTHFGPKAAPEVAR